jgi:hypothetical protein
MEETAFPRNKPLAKSQSKVAGSKRSLNQVICIYRETFQKTDRFDRI